LLPGGQIYSVGRCQVIHRKFLSSVRVASVGRNETVGPALNGATHRARVAGARSSSLARASGRLCFGNFGAQRAIEFQRAARDRETLLHRRIILREIAHHAAIFER
jgi:hypothetical protein